MKTLLRALTALLFLAVPQEAAAQEDEAAGAKQRQAERVRFEAADGVLVHADVHERRARPGAAVLVLFHDSSGSRGEVRPTLRRFQDLGYVCLAVDLRVGGKVSKVINFTSRGISDADESKNLLASEADMVAALEFARERYPDRERVAVGCSYSASHSLRLAGSRPDLVDGVLAFSPAEFFGELVDSPTWVRDGMAEVRCPVLVLSARAEQEEWAPLLEAIPSENKRGFVPPGHGRHGLRALWEDTAEHGAYWAAVESFLAEFFPVASESDGDGPR